MKKLLYSLLLTAFLFNVASAQKIKDEKINYTYIKLPMDPVSNSFTTYQSFIFAPYEEENTKKMEQYEADKKLAQDEFDAEMQEYPAKVAAAEAKYKTEMEEWKSKSLTEKIVEKEVLNENNKPVKKLPYEPRLRHVPQPVLKTSYDLPVVANTYLVLDGFDNRAENAIKIEVTIYGFDFTEPRQMTTPKKVTKSVNGNSVTSTVNYYHTEFSYRHPMAVKVTLPDGKEIINLTPQELNSYTIYKSPESEKHSSINRDLLIKTHEEKILQENLTFINELVNDKIGFKRTTRDADLNYVKSKDDEYQDLLIAFNDASSGLKMLLENETGAHDKFQKAIEKWNGALKESDINNKKARIDKDVTIAIYFNLLETHFAMRNVAEGQNIMEKLNAISLSNKERKLKDDYEAMFIDLKKRIKS